MIRVLVYIFFFFQPIADTFGGLIQDYLPISLIIRLVLIVSLSFYIFTSKTNYKFIYTLIISILVFLILIIIHLFRSELHTSYLIHDFVLVSKILYFPISLLFIRKILDNGIVTRNKIQTSINLYGYLTILSIIVGVLSGSGDRILGRGIQFLGYKGYFIGANEVGLIIILSTPYLFHNSILSKTPIRKFILFLLISTTSILVFTKSSLIAVIVVFYCYFAVSNKATRTCILISAFTSLAITLSQFKEKINTFFLESFFLPLINKDYSSFLFRGRQHYFEAISNQILMRNTVLSDLIFGLGESSLRSLTEKPLGLLPGMGTTFEMDLFDFIGIWGFIGLFTYLVLINYILSRKKAKSNIKGSRFTILLIISHSILAGHVFIFSPQVTTLLSLCLCVTIISKKYDKGI